MIDIHSHILAGFDDGPRSHDEMIAMCRMAEADGIGAMVATPHAFNGFFINSPGPIIEAVAALNDELAASGANLVVFPGMEVRVCAELGSSSFEDLVLGLNGGRYILVELPPAQIVAGFENLVEHLVSHDHGVVLAHAEKNAGIQQRPEYLFNLLSRFRPWDVLVQVTADSLTGDAGPMVRRLAQTLLEHNLAHVIATDAHSLTLRPPRLSHAFHRARGIVGTERAAAMVWHVPRAVLGLADFPSGETPPPLNPVKPRRRWGLF